MEADFSTGAVGAPAFTPFRMRGIGKRLVLLACMAATPMAFAAESKPIPTQAAEAIEPFAKQYSTTVSRAVNDFMAGTSGPLGEGGGAQESAEGCCGCGRSKSWDAQDHGGVFEARGFD